MIYAPGSRNLEAATADYTVCSNSSVDETNIVHFKIDMKQFTKAAGQNYSHNFQSC